MYKRQVETDLKLSGCVSADTLAALRAEGYDYKDGHLVPAGKEETMQEKVANTTTAAPLKLDVSVRVIEQMCIRDSRGTGRWGF